MFYATIIEKAATLTMTPVFMGFIVVVAVFSLAFLTLWALKKLDNRIVGEMAGSARHAGNQVKIAARGLGGFFLALVILAFVGLYFVQWISPRWHSHGSRLRCCQSLRVLRLWMPAPPLRTRFVQLLLERVGAFWVLAQTSSGLAKTYQLAV